MLEAGAGMLPILRVPAPGVLIRMAKNPENPQSDPNPAAAARATRRAGPVPRRSAEDPGASEGEIISELDELEAELAGTRREAASGTHRDASVRHEAASAAEDGNDESQAGRFKRQGAAPEGAAPAAGSSARRTAPRGFGPVEWAAMAGCALLAVVGGLLFFKFLYAHPAPTQGAGLPAKFNLPLAGSAVRLAGADAGWRERTETDKAAAAEVILPSVILVLDPGQASSGFVRVEFVDPDDRIRGDIQIVGLEGGRFKDGGRGEVVEDGGLKVRLAGTVGFRSEALYTSYIAGDEPRWSVRIKEGPDASDGPWTELGAALISNTKH
jgi:hypothetical protein